jgi:hypothetical protein
MVNSGQDADAAFFNLMHHFLAASQKGENATARQEPGGDRRTFRLTQRIAPGYCWEVPPDSAWIEVPCHDLAQAGFSFFLDDKPNFERLVAMFRSGGPIYVAAEVSRWRHVLVDEWGGITEPPAPSAGGVATARRTESKVLVSCTFLRRFNS